MGRSSLVSMELHFQCSAEFQVKGSVSITFLYSHCPAIQPFSQSVIQSCFNEHALTPTIFHVSRWRAGDRPCPSQCFIFISPVLLRNSFRSLSFRSVTATELIDYTFLTCPAVQSWVCDVTNSQSG